MNFIYIALLLLNSLVVDWAESTRIQSKQYVSNLLTEENVEESFWALSEIFYSNCHIQDDIIKNLRNTDYQKYFSKINCDKYTSEDAFDLQLKAIQKFSLENKSFNLLAYTLTQGKLYDGVSYGNLLTLDWIQDIPERKLEFLRNIIQYKKLNISKYKGYSPLIYFGILTSPNRNQYLDSELLNLAIVDWQRELINSELTPLNKSIYLSIIISAAYILYDDEIILKVSDSFLNADIFPNSYAKLRRINVIDFAYYVYGNYDESLKIQRNLSIPLSEFLNSTEEKQKIIKRHGAYLFTLGKYQESQKVYLELYQTGLLNNDYTTLNNLGITFLKLGQNNKYLQFQLDALDQNINDYSSLLNIYRNLFIYYSSINDNNTAINYINKAKEVAQNNNDFTELARIESFLGTFYWNNYKDAEKSILHFEMAKSTLKKHSYESYRDLLLGQSEIFIKTDSLSAAKSILDSLVNLTLSKSDTPAYLHTLLLRTAYYLKLDEIDNAASDLNEITVHSLESLDFELLTKFYTLKSELLFKSGNLRDAIVELYPVMEQIISRTRSNTDSQAGFWAIEEEFLDAFHLMVKLFQQSGQNDKALILLDQLKTINDAYLYNSPLVKAVKLTENELAEEKRLNQEIQALRNKYLNANENRRFELKAEIDRLSAKREDIFKSVNLEKQNTLPPIWSVQKNLQDDELVLHFTEIGKSLYLTQLTSDYIEINEFELDEIQIQNLTKIADQLANGKTDLNDLFTIYSSLNLDKLPENIRKLTVIPDNFLYRIPLEVLPTQLPTAAFSYGNISYMIEKYHFSYYTSLQEFVQNRRAGYNFRTTTDFSVFAISDFSEFDFTNLPSLPFAVTEAANVSNKLSALEIKHIFTGQNATKQKFIDATKDSRIVHVATHSEISEQNPLFSTIYLKGENQNDSLQSNQALYAYELFETTLNSDFIMLNSCSSGSGNYMQGTGIMGISRALRYAGAKSLALNLWSVNDKVASDFATNFYSYINTGYEKSEAIRLAKLDHLNTGNANPHYWGAYMMIGNPTPLVKKGEPGFLLYSGLFALILGFGFTAKRKVL